MGPTCCFRLTKRPLGIVTVTNAHLVAPKGQQGCASGIVDPRIMKLGVLDQVTAPSLFIRFSFFFSQNLDIDHMTSSLAAMLQRYPLFAGRMRIASNGDYEVALCGTGASLTTATGTAKLYDVLPASMAPVPPPHSQSAHQASPSSSYDPPELSQFLPKGPGAKIGHCSMEVAPFQAQITHFQGGGTALGVVIPHLLADQDTCRILLKAWAEEYTAACNAAPDMSKMLLGEFIEESLVKDEGLTGDKLAEVKTYMIDDSSKEERAVLGTAIGAQNEQFEAPQKGACSDPVVYYTGEELQSHAAPALPAGWTSSRFERRRWNFYPGVYGAYFRHVGGPWNLKTVAYHVTAARLAELKKEASKALAADGAPASPNFWISTNDALVARLRQVIAQLPGKSESTMHMWVNMRSRVVPALPSPALGNCIWPVSITDRDDPQGGATSADLGTLAAEVRTAIQTVATDRDYISNELRWLADNLQGGAATVPLVFQDTAKIVSPRGPVILSNWDWGGQSYSDLRFGGGRDSTPVWHQPPLYKLPNNVFVVPAAAAAPGGGVLVHITLHKILAAEMKLRFPAL